MAKSSGFVSDGEVLNYVNSGNDAIEYLEVVTLTDKIGIAGEEIAASGTGSLHVEGVWELPCGTGTISAGAAAYWNVSGGVIQTDAAGNIPAGYVTDGKAASATTVNVKLVPGLYYTVLGDLDDLDTTGKTDFVTAINEINTNIGDLTDLDTTDKTDIVTAINELHTDIGNIST